MHPLRRFQTLILLLVASGGMTPLLAGCSSTVLPADDGGQGGGMSRGGNGGTAGNGEKGGGGDGGSAGLGGAPGLGGATGSDAGDPCQGLVDQYAVAFAAARSCNLALNRVTCGQVASPTLRCPGCSLHVDNTKELDAIRTAYNARTDCWRVPCPAYLCISPGTGQCQANDGGGTAGTCVDVH